MPQMSPINWMIIVTTTMIILTMTCSIKWNEPNPSKNKITKDSPMNKHWKW